MGPQVGQRLREENGFLQSLGAGDRAELWRSSLYWGRQHWFGRRRLRLSTRAPEVDERGHANDG
ncbi:MAG: hypothetical protein DMF85_07045 [Acidobacteria bacterium]|nr:MAG: hypothetical protein DMF85_07045 [Acidobacteriota bacterium]